MKIRSHVKAGGEAEQLQKCQIERDYWKAQAEYMEALATSSTPQPSYPQPSYPTPTPLPVYPPVTPTGGWVGNTWYQDRSGTCG